MPNIKTNIAEVESLIKEQEELLAKLQDLLARMKRAFMVQDHDDIETAERDGTLTAWESTFASLS